MRKGEGRNEGGMGWREKKGVRESSIVRSGGDRDVSS